MKIKIFCVFPILFTIIFALFLSLSVNKYETDIYGPWMQKKNYDYWVENGDAHPYYMEEIVVNGIKYKSLTRSYIIEPRRVKMPLFQIYSLIDIDYKKNNTVVLTVMPSAVASESVRPSDAKGTITMHFIDKNTVECTTKTNKAWEREEFRNFGFAPSGIWVRGERK